MNEITDNMQIDLGTPLLRLLLADYATGRNIVWAADDYAEYGDMYAPEREMTPELLLFDLIKPRVTKAREEQQNRTRGRAEVFTPSWVCNLQNNLIDEEWFGMADVFNTASGKDRKPHSGRIRFPRKSGRTWQDYVNAKRMEITCGEAPYLVSRYDAADGSVIDDLNERIGLLDRKLRVVNENTDSEEDWLLWTKRAYKSVYAFEYHGDSLLLARENLLLTFSDNMLRKFGRKPKAGELRQIAEIISRNIWQMDGITYTAPYSGIPCVIRDMTGGKSYKFGELKFKFDAIVGNPPYQLQGGSGGSNDSPIYQIFAGMVNALSPMYSSLIIPARWFAAGRENLLSGFRAEMLSNRSIKKLIVYSSPRELFPNVEIKGGICYYLISGEYEGDCEYTLYGRNGVSAAKRRLDDFDILIREPVLCEIVKKVMRRTDPDKTVSGLISNDTPFGISSNPKSSKKNPMTVYESPSDGHDTMLFHIEKLKRKREYVDRRLITKNAWAIDKHKVIVPEAGGSGNDPKILGRPMYAPMNSVCSQSYLFAAFDTEAEAENFLKYMQTKFLRVLVTAMKISQSAPRRAYRFVPLQDFTENSDIDWSGSIEEIDGALYRKYSLERDEINYIEGRVCPMSID